MIPEIKFTCEKCGKEQDPEKKDSNKNWNAYTTKAVCECGGKFKMSIDGREINE